MKSAVARLGKKSVSARRLGGGPCQSASTWCARPATAPHHGRRRRARAGLRDFDRHAPAAAVARSRLPFASSRSRARERPWPGLSQRVRRRAFARNERWAQKHGAPAPRIGDVAQRSARSVRRGRLRAYSWSNRRRRTRGGQSTGMTRWSSSLRPLGIRAILEAGLRALLSSPSFASLMEAKWPDPSTDDTDGASRQRARTPAYFFHQA
jgi:hypothetical protein